MSRTRFSLVALAILVFGLSCTDVVQERPLVTRLDVEGYDFRIDFTSPPDTSVDVPFDVPPDDTRPDWQDTPDTTPDWRDTVPDWQPDWQDTHVDSGPDWQDTVQDIRPDVTGCTSDGMCPTGLRCRSMTGECVECLSDADCMTLSSRPLCDEGTGSCMAFDCTSDRQCNPPFTVCSNVGAPGTMGYCTPSCIPFQSSCPFMQWCFPSLTNPGIGACAPSQPAGSPTGGGCWVQEGWQGNCQDLNVCLPDTMGDICLGLCDPLALPGAPGDRCNANDGCLQLMVDDPSSPTGQTQTAWGICYPSCDFHAGIECAVAGQVCSPGELFESAVDLCIETQLLPEAALCENYGVYEGELCGANSACIDIAGWGQPGVRCWDLCIPTAAAPYGTINHPDCRRPDAQCAEMFAGTQFGLCI